MPAPGSNKIQRRAFVADLLSRRGNTLVIPGLGSPTWDTFAAGDSPEYLYSWGGMGLAVPTALGIALAQPSRRVLALTGDGEMMMGIGSLAVVADQNPNNLAILVLDNPYTLAAAYKIPDGTEAAVASRLKMAKTSKVVAVVQSNGKLYTATKEVKVTVGGCGG